MKSILTVGQSTSATKLILFSLEGVIVDKESAGHRQIYPKPGWMEHDF